MKLIRQPLADIPMAGIVKPGEELAGIGAVLVNDVHGNVVVAKLIAGGAASYCKPSDLFGEDRLKVPSPAPRLLAGRPDRPLGCRGRRGRGSPRGQRRDRAPRTAQRPYRRHRRARVRGGFARRPQARAARTGRQRGHAQRKAHQVRKLPQNRTLALPLPPPLPLLRPLTAPPPPRAVQVRGADRHHDPEAGLRDADAVCAVRLR